MLIFRHGKLISEAYLKDENDIIDRHLIWSCTKQVLSILVGIAIDQGLINSLDDPISKYFTNELEGHQDKANITLRNLITMQSGIAFSNDGARGQTDKLLRQLPESSVDFILSLPMDAEPGTTFHYNDGNPHLMSAILQKVTGMPTDLWADDVLFSRIGFRNYHWIRYKDGITIGAFGIETTPRELAKIALCVAAKGRGENQQIITTDWIEEMTKVQTKNGTGFEFEFGYYWWLDLEKNIHFMWGHGGQLAFVVPSKDLVVVFTSIPNTQGDYEIRPEEVMPQCPKIMDASN